MLPGDTRWLPRGRWQSLSQFEPSMTDQTFSKRLYTLGNKESNGGIFEAYPVRTIPLHNWREAKYTPIAGELGAF